MLFEATERAALCYDIKRKLIQRDYKAEKRVEWLSIWGSTWGKAQNE